MLDKAVDDWEDKPEADQTVANALTHFTKADNNHISRQANMKDVLRTNTAIFFRGRLRMASIAGPM
jgi:hypothetical protein